MRWLWLICGLLGGMQGLMGRDAPDPEGGIRIPLEQRAGFLWVEVRVGSSRPPLRFIVDTGAEVTVVEGGTADRLGLRSGTMVRVRGVGGSSSGAWITRLRADVAGVPLPRRLLRLDLGRFQEAVGLPVDGLLGADFFRRRVVRFDFERGELVLFRSSPGLKLEAAIPVRCMPRGFLVPAMVNGGPAGWYRLDTGCAAALHAVAGGGEAEPGDEGPVIGLAAVAVRSGRGNVRLGDRVWHDLPVEYHGAPIFPREDGLIGNAFLARFRAVTLDARRGWLWLDSE